MRPIASTCVASMQNIDAPDSASELMCVKCQSLASPSIAEYWHIGATMMRLGSARPRSFIGGNRALMGDFRVARKEGLPGHLKTRWWDYQRLATSSPRKRGPHIPPSSPAKAGDPVFQSRRDLTEKPRRTGSPGQALRYAHIF